MGFSADFRRLPLFCVCLSALALSACGGATTSSEESRPVTSLAKSGSAVDRAVYKALERAEAEGNKEESLALLENIHKRNSTNPEVATRYARALREDEQMNKARLVLTPHTKKEPYQPALTEMAMVHLGLGQYGHAEDYAREATLLDEKDGRAYLALGTALDAQGDHEKAEDAFREGLDKWKGDPAPILNNLALNLAAQGQTTEALSVLEKARKISPRRMEIERNYRIISTLNESVTARVPKPPRKPAALRDKQAKASFKGLKTDVEEQAEAQAETGEQEQVEKAEMTPPEQREPITLVEPASGDESESADSSAAPKPARSFNN